MLLHMYTIVLMQSIMTDTMYVIVTYIQLHVTCHHMVQSELETNSKRKEEVATLRKNPKQHRIIRAHSFTRCVYCSLLCYLSLLYVSSSGGTTYLKTVTSSHACATPFRTSRLFRLSAAAARRRQTAPPLRQPGPRASRGRRAGAAGKRHRLTCCVQIVN